MKTNLTILTAAATKSAIEKMAGVWFEDAGDRLASILRARISAVVANASGAFVVEFASVLLNGLLQSSDSMRKIEKAVSKLAREPVRTALEQFRVASNLRPANPDAQAHREQRFRECLVTLDRALSVAEDSEVPMVHLLRGTCALQVRGGEEEGKEHLRLYVVACEAQAYELRNAARTYEEAALRGEVEANKIQVQMGQGVGGGLIGMAVAEPRIRKASLVHEASSQRRLAEQLRQEADGLSAAADCAQAVIEIATKPG